MPKERLFFLFQIVVKKAKNPRKDLLNAHLLVFKNQFIAHLDAPSHINLKELMDPPYCCPTRVSKSPKKLPETVRLRLMMTSCHRASAKTHWKNKCSTYSGPWALVYIEHTHLGPRNLTWTNCPQVRIMFSRVNQRKHLSFGGISQIQIFLYHHLNCETTFSAEITA